MQSCCRICNLPLNEGSTTYTCRDQCLGLINWPKYSVIIMTTCLCLRNMDGVHFVIFFILSLLLVAGLHFIFVLHATSIVFRTMAPNAVNTTSSLTVDGRPPRFRRVQRFSAPQESYPFSRYVKVFSYFLHAHANMDNPGAKVAKRGPESETLLSRFSLTLSFLSSQNETRSSACGKSRSRSGSI